LSGQVLLGTLMLPGGFYGLLYAAGLLGAGKREANLLYMLVSIFMVYAGAILGARGLPHLYALIEGG
jgi:hypothetical protein